MTHTFYSHGKLLLTSEYIVLDGAKALAIPTKKGQKLEIKEIKTKELRWKSVLKNGTVWVTHTFALPLDKKFTHSDPLIGRLYDILSTAQNQNPDFLSSGQGYEATSILEFPQDWGLGSSSTLISNIATWASVDPYLLLESTFGGSGYDIACATAKTSITFQKNNVTPVINEVRFQPNFTDHLFFVHLNRKQNSRESIKHYRAHNKQAIQEEVKTFTHFTDRFINCEHLADFESLIIAHEMQLSRLLKTPTIKSQLFKDYQGAIKSLGGWGGDFILATGSERDMEYFKNKGYKTVVSYRKMVL